jgi:hypothetical protein
MTANLSMTPLLARQHRPEQPHLTLEKQNGGHYGHPVIIILYSKRAG